MLRTLFVVVLACPPAAVAAPVQLTWQARLLDGTGVPMEGTHTTVVRLFDAETGGTEVWSDTFTLTYQQGYTSAVLGSGAPLQAGTLTGGDRWVEVEVSGQILGPRTPLLRVPHAVTAAAVPAEPAPASPACTGDDGAVRLDTSTGRLRYCDGTAWRDLAVGRELVLDNGARRWADGSYAATCRDYLRPAAGVVPVGETGDGYYWIDPDQGGAGGPLKVECDMTTDGGGWTKLHLLPVPTQIGIFVSDYDACTTYTAAAINGWGFGHIIDADPNAAAGTCYTLANSGVDQVWPLPFYDAAGTPLAASHVTALSALVGTTVYDGDHYHYDMDAPAGTDGVGVYGELDGGRVDGGGGYVLFPSKSADPATGSDFYISDNDNPHTVNRDATDHEVLAWETIGHGFITHLGIQDRGNDEASAMTWGPKSTTGGARGVLTSTWFWVR